MSKYGPKEKSAFELAKEYGIFSEDVQENDYITNGELCQVFMYLYDHFRPVVHKPLKDGTLKNHPCRVAFQQCVKHGLCTDSENFISKIDEITTSVMVYRFADDFLTDSDIEYDFYDTTDTLEEVYQVEDFPNDLIQFTAGMVAVVTIDIAKLYIKDIVQRFRGFALKRQYRESVALLLEHRCMVMLFPPAIQEHCYMLDLLTTYPEVNEFSVKYMQFNTEIQSIFEKYFGYREGEGHVFSDPIYHYTSLSTLEKVSGGSPLRLSNAINLNDPSEGKELFDLLNSGDYDLDELGISDLLEPSPSDFYIISFNANTKDDIPMWQQYAAGCMGCRLAYRLDQFLQYPIYRVVYDKKVITQFIEALIAYHKSICEAEGTDDDSIMMLNAAILDILNQAAFFYKNSAYQYENEVRVIRRVVPANALEGDIREGEYFPRLYVELPAGMEFDSVLLGPKVSDYLMDHIKLGLQSRGIKCKVNRSEIKIR